MTSQINDLPHEILHLIFDLINPKRYATLRSVSTVWNSLLSPHVFQSITIFNYYRKKRTLDSILDDLENSLAKVTTENPTFGIPIGQHIQHLALLYDDTTADQLQRIPILCPNITSFTIVSKIMDHISSFEEVSSHHYQHDTQHICISDEFKDQAVLDDLNIRRALLGGFFASLGGGGGGGELNKKVTRFKLDGTSSYPMLNEIILPSLSHLVELDLGSVNCESDYDITGHAFIDTTDLLDLVQDSCPHLETLSMVKRGFSTLEKDLGVTNLAGLQSWVSTIRVWPRLTSLRLKLNIMRPDPRDWLVPTFMYLATRLTGLQHLQVTTGIDSHIQLGMNLRKDERLMTLLRTGLMDGEEDDDDGGRCALACIFSGLVSIDLDNIIIGALERLILFGYDDLLERSAITPTIQSINLYNCNNWFERQNDDRTVCPRRNFLRYCFSHTPLTSLKLSYSRFTDKILLDCLALGTNHLETLHMDGFNTIYIDSILDWCPHLQELKLFGCGVYGSSAAATTTTTAAAASSTIQHPHPLKVLDLTKSKVMDAGVFGLVSQRCRNLSILNLNLISIYDPQVIPSKSPATIGTKRHYSLAERSGVHIHMPHTKLSLCSLALGTRVYSYRSKKDVMHILLLPTTTTTAPSTDSGPAALWYSESHSDLCYEAMPWGKFSQQVLDKLAAAPIDNDDGREEALLGRMEHDGLLTIHCKDIQEMEVNGKTFYGPFGTP